MQSTKLLPNIQSSVEQLLSCYPQIKKALTLISRHGGHPYLVGGAVRDLLLGLPVHDMDIEVHAMPIEQLASLLTTIGPVSLVGKSFGVIKMHGLPIDWSLPRIDKAGRKPEVQVLPNMGIEEALRRRDLTINGMAIDLINYKLIDPFDGLAALTTKTLSSPDVHFFTEDPLRFYRVMQFLGRFEMNPDDELNHVCAVMDIKHVSIERIEAEFEKLLLKSRRPSLGLRWLRSVGRLHEILPALADTIGIPQDPVWHPEGDVFEHSMQTLDAAAVLNYNSQEEKLICLYASLCHDIGKTHTTELIKGRLRSHGHDQEGALLTKSLLKRIITKKKLITAVSELVKSHMQPGAFINLDASPAAYRRLALRLAHADTTIDMLAKLALADYQGRNPNGPEPLTVTAEHVKEFIKRAQEVDVLHQYEKPVLYGRDISDFVSPGPEMGKLLKHAYQQQLEKGIKDKDQLREYLKVLIASGKTAL
jgi:tRNA nucleotidyltransferase (CCA-adding enzyme)